MSTSSGQPTAPAASRTAPRSDKEITALDKVVQGWAGRRDGRRAARRLSHIGSHVWVARRQRAQADLDADVTRALQNWTSQVEDPISVLAGRDSDPPPETSGIEARVELQASGMAQLRAERRRRASQARQAAEFSARRARSLAARTALDTLCKEAATDVAALEARQNLLFALYTRAFLRAYSRATTIHAPEPTWLEHLVNPAALTLTQSVFEREGA